MINNYKKILKSPIFWILIATPILVVVFSSIFYILQGGDASYTPNIAPYRNFDSLLRQITKLEEEIAALNINFNNGFISKVEYVTKFEQMSRELNVLKLLYDKQIAFDGFNYGTFSSNYPHEKYYFLSFISRINLVTFLLMSFIYVFTFVNDRFKNDTWKYCFQNRNRQIILTDCFSGLLLLVVSYSISSILIIIFASPLYLQSPIIIKSYIDSAIIIKYQDYLFANLFGNLLLIVYIYFVSCSLALIFRKPIKTLIAFIAPLLIFIIPNMILNLEKYNFYFCSTISISNLIFSNTSSGIIVGGQIFLGLFSTALFIGSYVYFKITDFK